jgi:hypothetical protein
MIQPITNSLTQPVGPAPSKLPAKSQTKLNRRGLTELVLACALLSLLTFAVWTWQNQGYVAAMDRATPDVTAAATNSAPLLSLILRHPTIMLSVIVTEFILLLAITLALVPVTWWLRSDYLVVGDNAPATTPLRWLRSKLNFRRIEGAAQDETAGEYVMNEEGKMVWVPQPAAAEEVEQDVVMVQQSDGSLLAMVQQPDGTLVPADTTLKKEANEQGTGKEGENPEAGAPPLAPPGPTNDVLNFEETEEDPLADLADIGDILNSAFDEDTAIDPEREAISRSLDEVEIMALARNARHVLATFQQ